MRALVVTIFFVFMAGSTWAERRVALVMGADDYRTIRPLKNAGHDALAIEKVLKQLDFEVFLETNRDLRRMRRALEDFREDAAGADVALVFFAGHGVEISGENRLLPVDADASTLEALKTSTLPLEEVRAAVAAVAPIGLIILDACRNDPFGASDGSGRGATAIAAETTPELKLGLGRVGGAENVLFAFAAAPGMTASDGSEGNSPFTAAIVRYLATDGLEIRSVLTLVQQEVYDRSRGGQLPYVESGLPQVFFAATTREELPERERLLLAMAEITPAVRDELQAVAAEHDMPLAPLYGALIGSDAPLDAATRPTKLREAASNFVKFRDELRSLASADPEVNELRRQAEEQLVLGAYDAARALGARAAELDAASAEKLEARATERRLSQATTLYLNGGMALSALRYADAMADYQAANAVYAPLTDEQIPFDDQRRQIDSLRATIVTGMTINDQVAVFGALEKLTVITERRLAAEPLLVRRNLDLMTTYLLAGDAYIMSGGRSTAIMFYDYAVEVTRKVMRFFPRHLEALYGLAWAEGGLGDAYLGQSEIAEALSAYSAAIGVLEDLRQKDPANTRLIGRIAMMRSKAIDMQLRRAKLTEALASVKTALAEVAAAIATNPTDPQLRREGARLWVKQGDVAAEAARWVDALEAYRWGLAETQKLADSAPTNTVWQVDLAIAYGKLGDVELAEGDAGAAAMAIEAGHAIITGIASKKEGSAEARTALFESHLRLAGLRIVQNRPDAALAEAQTGLDIVLDQINELGDDTRLRSKAHVRIGDAYMLTREYVAALEHYLYSYGHMNSTFRQHTPDFFWQHDMIEACLRVGDLYLINSNYPNYPDANNHHWDAEEVAQQAIQWYPDHPVAQRDMMLTYAGIGRSSLSSEYFKKALNIALAMRASGTLRRQDRICPRNISGSSSESRCPPIEGCRRGAGKAPGSRCRDPRGDAATAVRRGPQEGLNAAAASSCRPCNRMDAAASFPTDRRGPSGGHERGPSSGLNSLENLGKRASAHYIRRVISAPDSSA